MRKKAELPPPFILDRCCYFSSVVFCDVLCFWSVFRFFSSFPFVSPLVLSGLVSGSNSLPYFCACDACDNNGFFSLP